MLLFLCLHCLLLGFSGFFFILSFFYFFFASCELSFHFFITWKFALHPWVANQVSHHQSFSRMIVKHWWDEIFELWWEEVLRVILVPRFPEKVQSVIDDQFIEHILLASHVIERLMAWSHWEKNNTKSKQVYCHALVRIPFYNFWCHIHWWA